MKIVRPIRIVGEVAFVPLTKGYEAVIDACDVHLVKGRNWIAKVTEHTVYAATWITTTKGRQSYVAMHRHLMGNPVGQEVDHKDGDGLNNRRSKNLRIATKTENRRNRRLSKDNTSGTKGVSWHKRDMRWCAQISVENRIIHLGSFETKDLACRAYCDASARFHGEFGRSA